MKQFFCLRSKLSILLAALALGLSIVSCSKPDNQLERLLRVLDEVIVNQKVYERKRLKKIEICRQQMLSAPEDSLVYFYDRMFFLFYSFQSDSALFYARKGVEASINHPDRNAAAKARINLANIYYLTGAYPSSHVILNGIDRSSLSERMLIELYSSYNSLYEALRISAIDPEDKQHYFQRAISYKDSILAINPKNFFVKSDRLLIDGKIIPAMDVLNPICENLDISDPLMGPVAYAISDIYTRLEMKDKSKLYLTKSSISDLVNSNKEYISLIQLSVMLYQDGDFRRAFSYVNKAVDDVTFCRAKTRIDQVAPVVSIINEAYDRERKTYMVYMAVGLVLVFIMAVAMFWMVMYLRKEKIHLSYVNDELFLSRDLEKEANRRTMEASAIKNTYITKLMLECIARIERLESYRKSLNRKSLNHDFNTLQKELKSNKVVELEWKSFYNVFDTTFLSLFPTFVTDLNNLLRSDAQPFSLVKGSLSAELRIYALIRLGIDSTDEISSLLRYSRSTIYAYRSRTRLKAIEPQSFEEDVKNISSI